MKFVVSMFMALTALVASQPIDLRTMEMVSYTWLESGVEYVDDVSWISVSTSVSFDNPVILISLPDLGGDTHDAGLATAPRIKNVVNSGVGGVAFDLKLFQPNGTLCTLFTPTAMAAPVEISWLVVEEGGYDLEGHVFIAGLGFVNRTSFNLSIPENNVRVDYPGGCNITGLGNETCRFPLGFDTTDIGSIATIQSFNYEKYMLLRGAGPQRRFMKVVLTPHDSLDPTNYELGEGETIGFFNFEIGLSLNCVERMTFETNRWDGITSTKIEYLYAFGYGTNIPSVFGMLNSQRSITDSTALRVFDRTSTGSFIITQEDTCADPGTEHTTSEVAAALVIGFLDDGDVVCGVVNLDIPEPPTSMPSGAPTPAPLEKYCADVLLYDIYGDGWGEGTELIISSDGENHNFTLDCKYQTVRMCNENGEFNFTVTSSANPVLHSWEVHWILMYMNVTVYGKLGTEIRTNNETVIYIRHDLDYESAPLNSTKCDACKHPPKPAPKKHTGSGGKGGSGSGSDDDHDSGSNSTGTNSTRRLTSKSSPKKHPRPHPPVHFPFELYDTVEEDGWWLHDDTLGYTSMFGFEIPNQWLYPRYYIVTRDRTKIIEDGTMCMQKDKEICEATLPFHGDFVFRVGGEAGEDADATWKFCGENGAVGDEVIFKMRAGKCIAVQKLNYMDYCDGIVSLVTIEGSLLFTGVSSAELTEYDTQFIEGSLTSSLHASSVAITSWTLSEDNNLVVYFKAATVSENLGFAGFSSIGLENLMSSLSSDMDTVMSGSFLTAIMSELNTMPNTQADVLRSASSVTLLSMEIASVQYVHDESSASVSIGQTATAPTLSSTDTGFSLSAGVVALAMVAAGGVLAVAVGFKLADTKQHTLLPQDSERAAAIEQQQQPPAPAPKKSLYVHEPMSEMKLFKSREKL